MDSMLRRLALTACTVVAACGPQFAVVPRGGQPQVTASSPVGLSMTALAEQWHADPIDLADFVTPIAVELTNTGPDEVRVSYADFALTDETGTRYPAVNPYVPLEYSQLDLKSALASGTLLAAHGGGVVVGAPGGARGGGGGAHFGAPGGARFGTGRAYGGVGGPVVGAPPGVRFPHRSWGYGWAPGGWSGYLVAPGLRGYFGPGLSYWGYDWPWYGPAYGRWVYWWGPSYYPARPSMDVLAYGLPEGVLPPGARVNGFLYFKKATDRARTLTLTWQMHTAREGKDLGSTNVVLEVREAR